MAKPSQTAAAATPPPPLAQGPPTEIEMLQELLESIQGMDAKLDQALSKLDDLETWAEKIDEDMGELEFRADYPGMEES